LASSFIGVCQPRCDLIEARFGFLDIIDRPANRAVAIEVDVHELIQLWKRNVPEDVAFCLAIVAAATAEEIDQERRFRRAEPRIFF
jgi:hypothetical protein